MAKIDLLIVPTGNPDKIVGLRAVDGRMPEILRLPGESLANLAQRALQAVRGAGPLLAYPLLRD